MRWTKAVACLTSSIISRTSASLGPVARRTGGRTMGSIANLTGLYLMYIFMRDACVRRLFIPNITFLIYVKKKKQTNIFSTFSIASHTIERRSFAFLRCCRTELDSRHSITCPRHCTILSVIRQRIFTVSWSIKSAVDHFGRTRIRTIRSKNKILYFRNVQERN